MRSKNFSMVPVARMDNKEKLIVRYIVGRLEQAYRDSNGKPIYARNMDQVIKDMWGITRFCKTLQRARYNETVMIALMKNMDTNTVWQIVRSNEHYRMFCYLVAMDHHIVKLGKRYNKLCDLEPVNRPSSKMRKLQKEIKKSRKMYKSCIKTMREIFDIQKVGGSGDGSSLRDMMGEWLDRHDSSYEDDIFFGLDGNYGLSTIESMDAYVNKMTRGRQRQQQVGGALGIFDGEFDEDFDEEDDDYLDPDGYSDVQSMLRAMNRPVAAPQPTYVPQQPVYAPPAAPQVNQEYIAILNTIQNGFDKMNQTMSDFLDAVLEDTDEGGGYVEEVGPGNVPPGAPERPIPGAPLTVGEMMDISAGNGAPPVTPETAQEAD